MTADLCKELHSHLEVGDKLRSAAWERFERLGLPANRCESYRYVRLQSLYGASWTLAPEGRVGAESLAPHLLPEAAGSALVFVNGRFAPDLSQRSALPDSLVILPMLEAMRSYGTFLRGRLRQEAKEESDPFALLNSALYQGGLFVYVPPGVALSQPIQVVHLSTDGGCSLPRLHLFAGRGCDLALVSTSVNLSNEPVWSNGVADFLLEEGARVRFYADRCAVDEGWLFESVRATLKRDAHFLAASATDGGAVVRSNYRAVLAGENAEVELIGGWMVEGSREAHAHVWVDHQAPNCRSRQLFKGVLSGAARSSFDGKIYVHQEAQQTDAFQLNNNLIVSPEAVAHSKPNLEIFADDVKASHGATVGQLDKEQLHYLKSRGISEDEARRLLVLGFIREVVDAIPYSSLRKRVEGRFARILQEA